ncbi:MAG TPA: hypothetical protein PKC72_06935 [Chitinophagaceae bacterium]|nr:hypothetical protein [Chitinophagaceae bacterium]
MRWLLFLSRLAFISGICILIWLVLAMIKQENDEVFSSTIITIGYLIGGIILPITNISYLVLTLRKKRIGTIVPRWLIISNIFFLLVLIYYIFYLNDPYYHQG